MKVKTSSKLGNKDFSIYMGTKGRNIALTSKVSDSENLFLELREQNLDTHLVYMPHTETLPYDFFSPSKDTKNKRIHPDKVEVKKFDPVVRKHVMYKEAKIK